MKEKKIREIRMKSLKKNFSKFIKKIHFHAPDSDSDDNKTSSDEDSSTVTNSRWNLAAVQIIKLKVEIKNTIIFSVWILNPVRREDLVV